MCLAESLLRVPDRHTADLLIADRISSADWAEHAGKADDLLVNASTWGLILTGQLVSIERAFTANPKHWIKALAGRMGEPIIRQAMRAAMHILGRAFVLGRTIHEALERSSGSLYSYDMLGEAAREEETALEYFAAYLAAIEAVGTAERKGASISVKLSALHPRFEALQRSRVMSELRERVFQLCVLAKRHRVPLTIDTEEADRLELTLDLFVSLALDPALDNWDGLGIAIQAYGKRALPALRELTRLAEALGRRIPIRLVKGAYWDAEIKHAQEQGLPGFPVFTSEAELRPVVFGVCQILAGKQTSRLSAVCGRIMPIRYRPLWVWPAIRQRLSFSGCTEWVTSCMRQRPAHFDDFPPVRTYAPVGGHKNLLAYLVRRLLENGANSSFVNRFLDETISPESLCQDPIELVEEIQARSHPGIPVARAIYSPDRDNSSGIDLSDAVTIARIEATLTQPMAERIRGASIISGRMVGGSGVGINSPANRDQRIGERVDLRELDLRRIFDVSTAAQADWNALGVNARAGHSRSCRRRNRSKDRRSNRAARQGGRQNSQ